MKGRPLFEALWKGALRPVDPDTLVGAYFLLIGGGFAYAMCLIHAVWGHTDECFVFAVPSIVLLNQGLSSLGRASRIRRRRKRQVANATSVEGEKSVRNEERG